MKNLSFLFLLFFGFCNNAFTQDCLPNGVIFTTQSEIDNFINDYPNCTTIEGNLKINQNTDINNLNGLSQITAINGDLDILKSYNLEELTGLENLTTIGGSLKLSFNYTMTNLSGLENLTSIGGILRISNYDSLDNIVALNNLISIDSSIIISSCDNLTSLSGLNGINSTYALEISGNENLLNLSGLDNLIITESTVTIWNNILLTSLNGLEDLDTIGGSFNLWNNSELLTTSNLTNLSFIGGNLSISENNNLSDLLGFSNIEKLNYNIVLSYIDGLQSFQGLNNLSEIGGNFNLFSMNSMVDFSGLENLTNIGGNFDLHTLDLLTNYQGLENLNHIGGFFRIYGNEVTTDLQGLENLNTIGGDLTISWNPSLTDISALHNLVEMNGELLMQQNQSLTSLAGLGLIDPAGISQIRIQSNPLLAVCHEETICNFIVNGGLTIISNNATGCATKTEIEDLCNDNFSKVKFDIFYDENQNQQKDSSEQIISNIGILIHPIDFTLYPNPNNEGKIYLEEGNYIFEPSASGLEDWDLTTDSTTFQIDISSDYSCDTVTFGFFPSNTNSHMATSITSPPTRCGLIITFDLAAHNFGNTITDGILWVDIGQQVDSVIFVNVPDTIASSTLVGWNFESLFPSHSILKKIKLQIPTPPNVSIGDSLYFNSYVEYEDVNGTATSDVFYYPTEIRCSFDPNDKLVNPSRNNNLTLFEEDLIYTIRFQNTGNDEAYDIIIRDTLDENLDPTTFRVLSTSHPNSLITTMEANQFLTFNFENIYLPDSTTNFEASQGYVSYLISSKEDLPEETLIENTASIYFDFNPPIVTNTTESIMVSELPTSIHNLGGVEGMKIQIFPNPISDILFIKKEKTETLEYQITDVNGRILMNGKLIDEIHNITFTKINSGVYFVKIINPVTHEYIIEKIVK